MELLYIILAALCFGIGAFLAKTILQHTSSIPTYFFEACGTLTVAFLVALTFKKEFTGALQNFQWTGYIFGLLYGIGTIFFIVALKGKPASIAAPVIAALYPLVTVVLSVVFLKEVITLKTGLGIVAALTGAFLLLF